MFLLPYLVNFNLSHPELDCQEDCETIYNCNKTACDILNLGSGNGVTVLEAIQSFEKVSGQKLNYEIGPRRPGDVIAIFANNEKSVNELGWHLQYDLDAMMKTAWDWELKLKDDADLHAKQNSQMN